MALWIASPNHYRGRTRPLTWIVWHSTESRETIGGAYSVAAGWFAKPASKVSAHIVADNGADPRYPDGIVECVKPGDTAWHAARANAAGYGIEIIGRASQTAADWTDPYSLAAITNACAWAKANPALRHIPARWLSDDQLRAAQRGHIVHSQVSRVLGGTTHTDPGTGFPYAFVMGQLQGRDPEGPIPPEVGTPKRTLRVTTPAMQGDDIRALQTGLNRTFPTYSQLVIDGVYGPNTAAVIREFQTRTGLVADGVVGPMTRRELSKYGVEVP